MRNTPLICAFALSTIWLAGCSCSDDNETNNGGAGGEAGGGAGGTMAGGSGGETGGTGGTPGGAGGTGGSGGDGGTGGTGGTGGVPNPPPPPYCTADAGVDFLSLPFDVEDHYTYLNQIGSTGDNDTQFALISNPNCDETFIPPEAGVGDAGSDAGASDAGVSDAGAGDAGDGGGGVACYGFHYVPTGGWAGVIFQTNEIETGGGAGEGLCVDPGATAVVFEARSDRRTAIKFGFVRGPAVGQTEYWLETTTEWQEFSMPVPAAEMYNTTATPGGVWNLFSAVGVPDDNPEPVNDGDIAAGSAGEAKIFIRNMHWE